MSGLSKLGGILVLGVKLVQPKREELGWAREVLAGIVYYYCILYKRLLYFSCITNW